MMSSHHLDIKATQLKKISYYFKTGHVEVPLVFTTKSTFSNNQDQLCNVMINYCERFAFGFFFSFLVKDCLFSLYHSKNTDFGIKVKLYSNTENFTFIIIVLLIYSKRIILTTIRFVYLVIL